MPKSFIVNSTLGKTPFYFEGTVRYLEGNGIEAENILPNSWRLREYEDYVENIIKRGKQDKISIIGHSYAGNVAVNVAKKHANEVEVLGIVDSVLEWEYQPLKDRLLTHILGNLPDSWKEKIGASDGLIRSMLDNMVSPKIDEELYEQLVAIVKKQGGKWNIKALYDGIEYTSGHNFGKELRELKNAGVEIHYIMAEESKDVKDYVKKAGIGDIIGAGNVHEIKDSGHLVSLENPKDFNELLVKILK